MAVEMDDGLPPHLALHVAIKIREASSAAADVEEVPPQTHTPPSDPTGDRLAFGRPLACYGRLYRVSHT